MRRSARPILYCVGLTFEPFRARSVRLVCVITSMVLDDINVTYNEDEDKYTDGNGKELFKDEDGEFYYEEDDRA